MTQQSLAAARSSRGSWPYLALLGAVLAMSSAAILIRVSLAPPVVLAFYRLALTALVLLPLLWRRRQELAALRPGDRWLTVLAGLLLAIHFQTWITSLTLTSVATATVLVTTHPFFVLLASALLYRERVSTPAVLGVSVAVAGTLLVALAAPGERHTLLGDSLALVGALTMAGYLLIGRGVRQRVGLVPYVTAVYAVAACTLLLYGLMQQVPFWPYPAREWALFAALALAPTIGGHTVLQWALRYLPAGHVSLSILGEPVGAALLAWVLLGEAPPPLRLAGAGVILVGIAVFVVGNERRPT